ncbi:hypothetical protein INT48_009635 [Thamnidium elegans]|uniref:Uncharacterized protein n=1 Tax=Thamnidium elegans TaxID=101142 RepID=A0A8H7W012_9FUNG|nr:hypothetical protein INT48_009635 [Thamnidium elegans]
MLWRCRKPCGISSSVCHRRANRQMANKEASICCLHFAKVMPGRVQYNRSKFVKSSCYGDGNLFEHRISSKRGN